MKKHVFKTILAIICVMFFAQGCAFLDSVSEEANREKQWSQEHRTKTNGHD